MTTAVIILILLLMFIFASMSVILSMTKQGRHEGYDIEPCPLDSDCANNEGGGCSEMPQCLKDYAP